MVALASDGTLNDQIRLAGGLAPIVKLLQTGRTTTNSPIQC